MSKIAEKRTDEIVGEYHDGDYTDHSRHNTQWVAFKQGYDQAVQDFLEKAENAISMISRHYIGEDYSFEQVWEQFKNYMQNEN